ncbi:MAG: hypothetical protein AB9856_13825 [Cellulosilyticaceae bacterium]
MNIKMNKFKKMATIMLVASTVAFVGCTGKAAAPKPESTPVATEEGKTSAIELSDEAVASEKFTIKAPKGWESSQESGVIKIKNDGDEAITALFVPLEGIGEVGIKEYSEQVAKDIKAKADVKMDLVNNETTELAGNPAAIFTIEMAFTEEYVNGWLKSGAITQERIDKEGGTEKFMQAHKITQVQVHMLTKDGLMTITGQTINGADAIKDALVASADTVVLK